MQTDHPSAWVQSEPPRSEAQCRLGDVQVAGDGKHQREGQKRNSGDYDNVKRRS
jgi:hypothetical protein